MPTIKEYKEELEQVTNSYSAFIKTTRKFQSKLADAKTEEERKQIIEEFGNWLYIY